MDFDPFQRLMKYGSSSLTLCKMRSSAHSHFVILLCVLGLALMLRARQLCMPPSHPHFCCSFRILSFFRPTDQLQPCAPSPPPPPPLPPSSRRPPPSHRRPTRALSARLSLHRQHRTLFCARRPRRSTLSTSLPKYVSAVACRMCWLRLGMLFMEMFTQLVPACVLIVSRCGISASFLIPFLHAVQLS